MRAKEYLKQVLESDRRINRKLEQLERLREMVNKATSFISDVPKAPDSGGSSREILLVKMIDLGYEINQDIDELVDMKRERNSLIEKIDRTEYQDVLIYRYLLAMNWEEVASKLDRSISYTYKLHGWALQELDKILAENQK